jgi:hypothetical protein
MYLLILYCMYLFYTVCTYFTLYVLTYFILYVLILHCMYLLILYCMYLLILHCMYLFYTVCTYSIYTVYTYLFYTVCTYTHFILYVLILYCMYLFYIVYPDLMRRFARNFWRSFLFHCITGKVSTIYGISFGYMLVQWSLRTELQVICMLFYNTIWTLRIMGRLQYTSGTVFKTINPYDELFRQQILQDREWTIMGLNNK